VVVSTRDQFAVRRRTPANRSAPSCRSARS